MATATEFYFIVSNNEQLLQDIIGDTYNTYRTIFEHNNIGIKVDSSNMIHYSAVQTQPNRALYEGDSYWHEVGGECDNAEWFHDVLSRLQPYYSTEKEATR